MIAGIGLQFAAPLLGKLFGGDPFKDYKKFIQSEYGVKVESKSLLSKIQQIGQSKFGAEAPKRKIETVKLPEVRDMVNEYAAAKGLKGGKNLFSGAEVGDQFSAMNQIAVKREFGGAARAGQALLVGERRPEIFIPRSDGTVLPNLGMMGGGKSGGMDASLMESVNSLMDELAGLLSGLKPADAGAFYELGMSKRPGLATREVANSFDRRDEHSKKIRDNMQYR